MIPSSPPQGLSDSVERHLKAYFAAHEDLAPMGGLYGVVLREVETPLLRLVLEACGGNQLRAAALLGLNRNTLRKKLRDLGLLAETRARRGRKGRA